MVPDSAADAHDYCADFTRSHDEDYGLALGYAPPEDALRVSALYALQVEIRRIPGVVSEPPLGEIRLQWWRDALDEIAAGGAVRAHPVVEALKTSGAANARVRSGVERAMDAIAPLLYGERPATLDALEAYFRDSEGWLAAALTGKDDGEEAARAAGGAYGLARFGRALSPGVDGVEARARKLMRETRKSLPKGEAAPIARGLYLSLTDGYAARAQGAPWPVAKRARLFWAMLTGAV